MLSRFLILSVAFIMSSCAYMNEKSYQDFTVETPGAHDAICYVLIENIRFSFRPPQTQVIPNSKENLTVDCYAPGNRHRTIVIEPALADSAHYNVLTAGLGYAWDSASGALYKYPDTVYVDFTGVEITPESLPAQNNPDIRHPDDYDLEEFKAKDMRLNSDRDYQAQPIQERQPAQSIFAKPVAIEPLDISEDK